MIKKILVGLGGPLTKAAIQRGIEIATKHRAELTGVTVLDVGKLENVGPVPLGAGAFAKDLRDYRVNTTKLQIEGTVQDFVQDCKRVKIPHSVHKETGDPFSAMISLSRYHDLVVFGFKSIFEYGFVHQPEGALTRFIREDVRPILSVSEKLKPIKRVLIAYSGSMHSAKAMKDFIQSGLWPHAKIKIVCFNKKEKEAREILKESSAYCLAHGFNVETENARGEGKELLLKYASKSSADLIVMGNSMRNLIVRQVMGDIALHTIQHSNKTLFLSQ